MGCFKARDRPTTYFSPKRLSARVFVHNMAAALDVVVVAFVNL